MKKALSHLPLLFIERCRGNRDHHHTNTEGSEKTSRFYPTEPAVTTETNVGPIEPPVIISTLSPSVRQPSYAKVWKISCYPIMFFFTAFFWGIGCALSSLVILGVGCLCFALGVGYLLMEEV